MLNANELHAQNWNQTWASERASERAKTLLHINKVNTIVIEREREEWVWASEWVCVGAREKEEEKTKQKPHIENDSENVRWIHTATIVQQYTHITYNEQMYIYQFFLLLRFVDGVFVFYCCFCSLKFKWKVKRRKLFQK